jgi:hypothetical protein
MPPEITKVRKKGLSKIGAVINEITINIKNQFRFSKIKP